MDVMTERHDDVLSANVDGRIDGSNVVQFEEAIRTSIEESDRAVIMDFEKLVYISSAGLRALLMTAKSLKARDAKLVLCSLTDSIREVFEVSGFDKILPIHPTRAAALASLNG